MVSQKELLQETFADIMRGIGAAAKTMAPGLVSAYADVAAPFKAFGSKQPVMFLRKKLKTDYFNTFDYKSVRIGKPVTLPNDPQGGSRISVPFTAKRIKGISTSQQPSLSGSTSQQPSLSGGVDAEQTYTAILTRSEKGIDGEYSVEIRDSQNRTISGAKEKPEESRKNWSKLYATSGLDSTSTIKQLALWIQNTVKNFGKEYLKELWIDELSKIGKRPSTFTEFLVSYLNMKGSPLTTLDQDSTIADTDINLIKQFLIDQQIIVKESTKNKKSQLNFLIDSYNMRYEVSINKGN